MRTKPLLILLAAALLVGADQRDFGAVAGRNYFAGDYTPSQITANQNDYNPFPTPDVVSVLRLSTDASREITGLAGGADGRMIQIYNVGGQNIVLKDESASSSAANRFALIADMTLAPDEAVDLWYDSTTQRWRPRASKEPLTRTARVVVPPTHWTLDRLSPPTPFSWGVNFHRELLLFDPSTDQNVYLEFDLPAEYDSTVNPTLVVNWSTNSATTGGSGDACWCAKSADFAEDAGSDPASEQTACAGESNTAADDRMETTITLTGSNFAAGNGQVFMLYRDANASEGACSGLDDLASAIRLHTVTLAIRVTS